jgi:PST family polysaccharide transporter
VPGGARCFFNDLQLAQSCVLRRRDTRALFERRLVRFAGLVPLLLPPSGVRDVAALSDQMGSRTAVDGLALDRSLLHGVAWTATAKWASQALSWVSWLVVARLLSPEDYGLVGMAAIYLGLITLLSEFGLGTAVLAVRQLSDEQLSQLNGLAVLLGLAGLLLSCGLAIPLGRLFRAPDLPVVVVAMSTTFLITAFKAVPFALLQRDLRFKALGLIDLCQALVLAVSMIGFAVAGFRYWTLVCGGVLGAVISTGGVLRLRRLPFAWPRPESLKRVMTVSSDVVIGRLCWYASANADFLIAGRVLGKAALGFYGVGWTLASLPVDKVAALVGQVTPAFFSAVQKDPAAIRRYLLRITEGLALITFPVSLGLALVARDFVLVVLGAKWEGTIVPLQLLAAYAAFRSITPLLPQVLQITGDSRFEMWRMVAAAVVMPTCFYFGAQRWGTVGLAMAWLLVDPLLIFVLYWRLFSKIQLSPRAYFVALWPALSGTALMAAAVLAVGAFGAREWTAGLRLAAQIGVGAISYGLACLVLHRERFTAFYNLVRATRRGPEGGP